MKTETIVRERDEALEFAAKLCDTIASNVKDFNGERRKGAGQCAALIRSHKTSHPKGPT